MLRAGSSDASGSFFVYPGKVIDFSDTASFFLYGVSLLFCICCLMDVLSILKAAESLYRL